jgi:hypothetical protein
MKMTKVTVVADEWYPVLRPKSGKGATIEVPIELWETYVRLLWEFEPVWLKVVDLYRDQDE